MKAAAGCQLWRGKVCLVEVGFREHRVSLSLSQAPHLAHCLVKLVRFPVFHPFSRGYTFEGGKKKSFMVLAEDFTMSRTDEVHRLTENVYKVRLNSWVKF